MTSDPTSVQTAIAQEASEWFVLNRGESLSAEQADAFSKWLRSSPLHIEEYLKTAALSNQLREAAHGMSDDIDALLAEAESDRTGVVLPLHAVRADMLLRPVGLSRSRRAMRWVALAASLALVLVGVTSVWWFRDSLTGQAREFATAHGEQRSWLLPDGSSLELNADSAAIVRFSRTERLVQVVRGQALFQVAHEARRRFRVAAGDAGVVAIGTRFDVKRDADATLVTVVEGRVAVYTGAAPALAALAVLPADAVRVGAGQQARIASHSHVIDSASVNVQQVVAWAQHQIVFDKRPLSEVAGDFNRYNMVPIVIEGDALRSLPITGVFSEYDSDSFVQFLSRLDGVAVRRDENQITVTDSADH